MFCTTWGRVARPWCVLHDPPGVVEYAPGSCSVAQGRAVTPPLRTLPGKARRLTSVSAATDRPCTPRSTAAGVMTARVEAAREASHHPYAFSALAAPPAQPHQQARGTPSHRHAHPRPPLVQPSALGECAAPARAHATTPPPHPQTGTAPGRGPHPRRRLPTTAAAPLYGSAGLGVWWLGRGGFGPGCGVRGGRGWGGEVGVGLVGTFSGADEVDVGLAGSYSGRRGRARWVLVCRERPLHPQTLHVREGLGLTRTCSTGAGRCRAAEGVFGPPRTSSARPGRCPSGRGALAAARRSARRRALNLHGAGPPRQNARPGCTWLPTAPAPGSGTVCCATSRSTAPLRRLLRHFGVNNAS